MPTCPCILQLGLLRVYPSRLIQAARGVQQRMARKLAHKLRHQPMLCLDLMLQRLQARGHGALNYSFDQSGFGHWFPPVWFVGLHSTRAV